MKKIFALAVAVLLSQTLLFAQTGKNVQEKNVPERYVKDFNKNADSPKNVQWTLIDSMVYEAHYTSGSDNECAIRFSPKGLEKRYYIDSRYYPHSIMDSISANHPGYKVKELYILEIKNKSTYQVLIGKRKGLFVKKWRNMRYMNFETDGKFIDEIEL